MYWTSILPYYRIIYKHFKIDGYLKDMLNKCKRIQPEYPTQIKEIHVLGFLIQGTLHLFEIRLNKSLAKEEKERVCYIRKMSSTIMPSEEEKRDLYNP